MNPNENRHNGLYRNGAAGVTERDPGAQIDPLVQEGLDLDDAEEERADADQQQTTHKRRSRRLVGGILILMVLAVMGVGWWMISGGRKTKITVPVRDSAQRSNPSTARGNDDSVTAQAIAEVRGTTASPTPALPASSAPATGVAGTTVISTTPVTVPTEGVGGMVRTSTTEAASGQSAASSGTPSAMKRAEITPHRNPERSIRCAPIPTPISVRQPVAGTPANQPLLEPALLERAEPRIPLPPFGALLPVRTLGTLYTLRQSLARFELTRDMRGQGWEMKKGAILIGQQQGSEHDRAYISLMGFIEPASGKLVKLSGDFLGTDGAPGLRGKPHKVSPTWKRVLDRAATSGVALAQAALSRGNSTTVVLPGAVAPELTSLTSASRREFVEVQAGSAAYVMITRLPEQAQGVDAQLVTTATAGDPIAASDRADSKALSDEETAALIESGSPEQVRAAMPRMSPELRRIAEMVLKEPGK